MISINTVCQNVRHKGNFEICRPDGSGDDLLVIFKTSAVLIQNGEEITVSPDSLILYSKGTMQHYKTLCGSYVNHFVHFDTDDTELMNGIKTDTLITSADIPAIEELLAILCRENVAGSTNRKDPDSMYSYYKTLIALRKDNPALMKGNYRAAALTSDSVTAYFREADGQKLLVVHNFAEGDQTVSLADCGDITVTNVLYSSSGETGVSDLSSVKLAGNESVVLELGE